MKQKQTYSGLFVLLILLTGWMRLQAADSVFLRDPTNDDGAA